MNTATTLGKRFFPEVGERLIRIREVIYRTGLARSTIYKMMKAGTFPAAIRLGKRFTAWTQSSVDAWIQSKGHACAG